MTLDPATPDGSAAAGRPGRHRHGHQRGGQHDRAEAGEHHRGVPGASPYGQGTGGDQDDGHGDGGQG